MAMIRRTSLNLDFTLVDEAKHVLQTVETTETIHRALADVVRHAKLRRLVGRRFEFSAAELEQLREARSEGAVHVATKKAVGAR